MKFASVLAAALVLASSSVARADDQPKPSDPPKKDVPAPAFQEGSAAPPTAAGSTGLALHPGLEIIADYDLHVTKSGDAYSWFHEFNLERGHLSLDGSYGPASARFVFEAVRSENEGALLGVGGDSLLMRVREASVGFHAVPWLDAELGVVPTFTVPELDGTFALLSVAQTPLESTGLLAPADLGATVRATFPQGFGFVAIGAYNGEGYTNPELNRGKNLEFAAEVHPFARTQARAFGIFGSFVNGSSGTGSALANRATGALLWQGLRIRAGTAFTYAWGVGEDGAQRSWLLDAFARAEPVDRLLLGVRGFWWARNAAVASDAVGEVTAGVGYRIVVPLEVFITATRTFPESVAAEALPTLDSWDGRLVGHVVF